jgi:hypothetical protein
VSKEWIPVKTRVRVEEKSLQSNQNFDTRWIIYVVDLAFLRQTPYQEAARIDLNKKFSQNAPERRPLKATLSVELRERSLQAFGTIFSYSIRHIKCGPQRPAAGGQDEFVSERRGSLVF